MRIQTHLTYTLILSVYKISLDLYTKRFVYYRVRQMIEINKIKETKWQEKV